MPSQYAPGVNPKDVSELRNEVSKMNKTAKWSNGIMIFLTLALVILTIVLVWQGLVLIRRNV